MTCSDLYFRRIIGHREENGLKVRDGHRGLGNHCKMQSLKAQYLVAYLLFPICSGFVTLSLNFYI